MSRKIFGITYGNHTTEFIPYENKFTEKTWRFEYNPMLDIIENHVSDMSDEDYLGIFSWKFTQKTGMKKADLDEWLSEAQALESGIEVYNLSPFLGHNIAGCGCFMDWSAKGHGETLRDLIKQCCRHTGMDYHNNPEQIVYANQFIAQKRVYIDYMESIIKPSIELLEGELWSIANKPAGYTAGIELKELKKNTGLEFYNYVPFVLERLMMQFIVNWRIKTD